MLLLLSFCSSDRMRKLLYQHQNELFELTRVTMLALFLLCSHMCSETDMHAVDGAKLLHNTIVPITWLSDFEGLSSSEFVSPSPPSCVSRSKRVQISLMSNSDGQGCHIHISTSSTYCCCSSRWNDDEREVRTSSHKLFILCEDTGDGNCCFNILNIFSEKATHNSRIYRKTLTDSMLITIYY